MQDYFFKIATFLNITKFTEYFSVKFVFLLVAK